MYPDKEAVSEVLARLKHYPLIGLSPAIAAGYVLVLATVNAAAHYGAMPPVQTHHPRRWRALQSKFLKTAFSGSHVTDCGRQADLWVNTQTSTNAWHRP